MKVKDIDYGNVEMAPLKTLYELPASIKNIPPQANHAKLAGIRKKQGMNIYSEGATQLLDDARRRRQVIKEGTRRRLNLSTWSTKTRRQNLIMITKLCSEKQCRKPKRNDTIAIELVSIAPFSIFNKLNNGRIVIASQL